MSDASEEARGESIAPDKFAELERAVAQILNAEPDQRGASDTALER